MNDRYLLNNLAKAVVECRKAQKAYYAYRKPFDDPMKKAYLQEAQRREQDLDKLMVELQTHDPTIGK